MEKAEQTTPDRQLFMLWMKRMPTLECIRLKLITISSGG